MATSDAKVLRDELSASESGEVASPSVEQADELRSVCSYPYQRSVRVDNGLTSASTFSGSEISISTRDRSVVCQTRDRAEFAGCACTTAGGVRRAIKIVVRRVGERQVINGQVVVQASRGVERRRSEEH